MAVQTNLPSGDEMSEVSKGGATIDTPDGMQYAELAILKSTFKMNKVGLKHSAQRGKAIRPMYAKMFGLKPSDSYDMYIAEIQKRMDVLLEAAKNKQS